MNEISKIPNIKQRNGYYYIHIRNSWGYILRKSLKTKDSKEASRRFHTLYSYKPLILNLAWDQVSLNDLYHIVRQDNSLKDTVLYSDIVWKSKFTERVAFSASNVLSQESMHQTNTILIARFFRRSSVEKCWLNLMNSTYLKQLYEGLKEHERLCLSFLLILMFRAVHIIWRKPLTKKIMSCLQKLYASITVPYPISKLRIAVLKDIESQSNFERLKFIGIICGIALKYGSNKNTDIALELYRTYPLLRNSLDAVGFLPEINYINDELFELLQSLYERYLNFPKALFRFYSDKVLENEKAGVKIKRMLEGERKTLLQELEQTLK